MPIKTVQNSGLTATSRIQSTTHGVNATYTGADGQPTSALTHQQLDENFKSIWPVGSVYINVSSNANPRDLIGFGVWASLGRQTILVGKNSASTDNLRSFTVDDSTGLINREILVEASGSYRNKIHEILSSTQIIIEADATNGFPTNGDTLTGETSNVTISLTSSATNINTTDQGLSSKISAVSVFRNASIGRSELIITTTADHKFSKGQRVTLSGITGHTGAVNPNKEREIVSVDNSTRFRVDYRSPSVTDPDSFHTGIEETLGSSNASATLFGTRYDEGERSGAEQIPFIGTGGKLGQKMSVDEFPPHNHTVNWSFVNTINQSRASGKDGSDASKIGGGDGKFRDPQWGIVDQTQRGKYSATPLTNDMKLANKGIGETYTINGNPYTFNTNREAHSNLMPFMGAYFWVRIADPVEE